jgi:hypothetical protein
MIEFNPLYDSIETVKAIRATALSNLASGIVITEFISEGNQIKGVVAGKTEEILLATERYLDLYYGELITETNPNFYIYG